jgi:hypothetical protein
VNTAEVISAFALATSLASLAIAFAVFRRDKSHLRVETSIGYLMPPTTMEEHLVIKVVNDGRYTETVTSIGLLAASGGQLFTERGVSFPEGPLPWQLAPNDARMALSHGPTLLHSLKTQQIPSLVAAFADTKARRYKDHLKRGVREYVNTR